jgi:hypothetical protein
MILTAKHVSNKNTEKKMLNWDEYNKEDTQVAPAIKNTTTEHQNMLSQLLRQQKMHQQLRLQTLR